MEDRKNYAFESRSSPLLVCNLFAIQSEGPQNAQKQSPAQTKRIHTPSALATFAAVMVSGRSCVDAALPPNYHSPKSLKRAHSLR